jgi:alpha-L-fucosidase 2
VVQICVFAVNFFDFFCVFCGSKFNLFNMKPVFKIIVLACLIALMFVCTDKNKPVVPKYRIWFKEPAKIWEATLPLGNGHMGMMPDGQIVNETITLNDITLWSGGAQDPDNPEAAKYLPEIQKLLFEGKNDKAQELVYKTFVCKGAGSGRGMGAKVPYGSYEVLGNLHLQYDFDSLTLPQKYYRQLSLDDATALTTFEANGIHFTREYFVSFNHDVGVIRLTANKNHKINLKISLDRPEKSETIAEGNTLKMRGQLENGTDGKGMRYLALVSVKNKGGTLLAENNHLSVINANEAIIFVSLGTDFKKPDFETSVEKSLDDATKTNFGEIVKTHKKAYQEYFNRVEITLPVNPERELLPTPERLVAFAGNPDDNGLVNLYFQYGRYLLISSTYKQILPPNLQGLWSHTVQTPWNGDYHLNINVQMNHWPSEITNLSELQRPLIELTKSLVDPGTKTARVFYNAGGWVAHMMTNIRGFTAPGEHPSWGATNTGGAWLCAHLWEHYDYNRDTAYLEEIYPVLKGASQFFLSMLVTEPVHGWLVTAPTTSPENAFLMPGTKKPVNICMGSTMDNQLIRELFGNTVHAAQIMGVDQEFSGRLTEASSKLPPNRIGSDGRLMEWLEEYEEQDPHHRHSSHLYGLHPGNQITPEGTPELADAARKSLEARGDGGTGWSRAWKINFWARLYDGNHAFTLLKNLLDPVCDVDFNYTNKGGTYPNLFCAHPPFQMDGNWGGCAGIAEMFIQSHAGFIHIIPALPDRFSDGSFKGLKVRGGGVISASWKEKKLVEATLLAEANGIFKIKIPDDAFFVATVNGKPAETFKEGNLLQVSLKKGDSLEIKIQ